MLPLVVSPTRMSGPSIIYEVSCSSSCARACARARVCVCVCVCVFIHSFIPPTSVDFSPTLHRAWISMLECCTRKSTCPHTADILVGETKNLTNKEIGNIEQF